jgi:hypothetical protein
MGTSSSAIFVVILIFLLNIGAIAFYMASKSALTLCETTENPSCPVFFCSGTTSECKNKAYRQTASGATECQVSLLSKASQVKATSTE